MKTIYLLSIVMFTSFGMFSQTELIAFKSHSGDLENFKFETYENIGIPPMRIDTIIILNDSTIVEISSRYWSGRPNFCVKDTVVNHPMYQQSSDYKKLRGNYYDTTIVFINYDTLTVKQKNKIAKKKKKENMIAPMSGQFPNSKNQLLVILSLFMIMCAGFVWQINKHKINV